MLIAACSQKRMCVRAGVCFQREVAETACSCQVMCDFTHFGLNVLCLGESQFSEKL